jgi:hypothetical protein
VKWRSADVFEGLTQQQISIVWEIVDALRQPVRRNINPASDLCTPAFVESFENRLTIYHALNEQPLTKKTFEFTFAKAMADAGHISKVIPDSTNPGTDVLIDEEMAFSLKTEAAKNISPTSITISKLMEARWIRDCQTGEDYQRHILERIVPHLQQYHRILMLRAFTDEPTEVTYVLAEIPRDVLLETANLTTDSFSPRTSNGSTSADVVCDGRRLYRLSLDGSVEKITVRNLALTSCVIHGSWTVPLRLGAGLE